MTGKTLDKFGSLLIPRRFLSLIDPVKVTVSFGTSHRIDFCEPLLFSLLLAQQVSLREKKNREKKIQLCFHCTTYFSFRGKRKAQRIKKVKEKKEEAKNCSWKVVWPLEIRTRARVRSSLVKTRWPREWMFRFIVSWLILLKSVTR